MTATAKPITHNPCTPPDRHRPVNPSTRTFSSAPDRSRRQFAQEQLAAIADQPSGDHTATLRAITARVLGFTPANTIIAAQHRQLPGTATVIGTLPNKSGPDYMAVHYDLSLCQDASRQGYITLHQVQAANELLQGHTEDEVHPLLIFTLPECKGIQFVTGNPMPGNRHQLKDVIRVTAYRKRDNHTVLDCLEQAGKAIAEGTTPKRAFQEGFSPAPVAKAFFEEYKTTYEAAVAALLSTGTAKKDAEQFTQTIFNRLLFIHFISLKGWLSFNGDTDYLNALWRDYSANERETNFYLCRLIPLFSAGLNNPQSRDLMRNNPALHSIIGDVPFLNGGLFEPTPLDNQADKGVLTVPDDCIAPLLTDLFRRYNFTVMEATHLDTEVAVDPEMLGKLFEETVNERHSNGTYYTPRPVVAFMCREAIKGYLSSRDIAGLDNAKIADLVDERDPDDVTPQQALAIANAVSDMKTVDPACGSGAFLLGMLQEILALNHSLFRAGNKAKSSYQQKLEIITKNIYGADKDGLAISTAMLRIWLSLAVDYDGSGPPEPLPNLDLKLAVGDAISAPNPQQTDFERKIIEDSNLQKDIAAYTTVHGQQKSTLKQRVDDTKAKLRQRLKGATPADAVEWRIDFADVMQHGGFDIVIANPPYVRQEEITPKTYKDALNKAYADAAVGRSDVYCYFYARGLQLLRDGGIHVFICSNSWLDVGYGAKLQEYLLDNATVEAIYESAVERQFSTAAINTIISVARKGQPDDNRQTRFVRLMEEFETALTHKGQKRVVTKTAAELRAAGASPDQRKSTGKYAGDKWGGKYLRAPDIYHRIINQHGDKLVFLEQIAAIRRGITTGNNRFFILNRNDPETLRIDSQFLTPIMTTPRESRQIAVNASQLPGRLFHCPMERNLIPDAGALNHIDRGQEMGLHLQKTALNRRIWYDIGRVKPTRLLLNKMIDATSHAFISTPAVAANNVFYCIDAPELMTAKLCASLNSTLGQLMINTLGRTNFGGGMLELSAQDARRLPVVRPELMPDIDQSLFCDAEWSVTRNSAQQRKVDAIIAEAIGITPSENRALHEAVAQLVTIRRRKAFQ